MNSSQVTAVLVGVIAPYIGQNMARSAVEAHAASLGFATGPLADEQAEALVTKLGVGLNIFVGREKSARVVDEMRQALAEAKGGRS
jgi:hypothetical protein